MNYIDGKGLMYFWKKVKKLIESIRLDSVNVDTEQQSRPKKSNNNIFTEDKLLVYKGRKTRYNR